MLDWNVVVTTHEHRYRHARAFLLPLGVISDTDFYNVLVMRVANPALFLEILEQELSAQPGYRTALARVLPVTESFQFQSPQEFERKAEDVASAMVKQVEGSRFHVRMHRRGFKGRLSSQEEEVFLDHCMVAAMNERGMEGQIDFDDPDWILALETVGQRAGMSVWHREQLQHYPLLKLD